MPSALQFKQWFALFTKVIIFSSNSKPQSGHLNFVNFFEVGPYNLASGLFTNHFTKSGYNSSILIFLLSAFLFSQQGHLPSLLLKESGVISKISPHFKH